MQEMNDIVTLVSETLGAAIDSNVVVGTPFEVGNVTLVPLSRVSLGLGGGGGQGEGDIPEESRHDKRGRGHGRGHGHGTGFGSGGGARVRPVAVVAFTADGVEVLTIPDKKGKLDRLLEKIPEVVELVQRHAPASAREG